MFKTVGSKFKMLKIDNVKLLDKALQHTIVILQALAKCCKIFRVFRNIVGSCKIYTLVWLNTLEPIKAALYKVKRTSCIFVVKE